MIPNFSSKNIARKGSYGIAFIFALIAVMGMFFMFSSPPGISKHNKDSELLSIKKIEDESAKPGIAGYMTRAVLITGTFLMVFLVGIKWYQKKMRSDISDEINIEIVGKRYISPKQYLMVVKVDSYKLLLGVTEGSINRIMVFGEDINKEMTGNNISDMPESFSGILQQYNIDDKN